jgi:hypothetical protein
MAAQVQKYMLTPVFLLALLMIFVILFLIV